MTKKLAVTSIGLLFVARVAGAALCTPVDCTRTDAMVPVAEGVSLDASLYVPDTSPPPGGFPLIVRQHGGGSDKDNPYDTLYAKKAVGTGNYAALMYSVRGHGSSGGVFDFFGPQSVADFSKVVDWVASTAPEHVNAENVGVSGYSQGGGTSLLPAAFDSRVKAAAVGNTFDSLRHALKPEGCYKFSWANGIFLAAYKVSASRTDDATAAHWGLALTTDTEDLGPPAAKSVSEEMAEHSPLHYLDRLNVPIFWSNSWEDQLFPADHPESILTALETRGIPVHYWFASGGHAAGPNDPDDEAGKEAAMLRWFDWHLRSDRAAKRSFAKFRVDYAERLPAGGWTHKTAKEWPIPDTLETVLYPHGDGTLAAVPDATGEVGTIVNDVANTNVKNDAILNEIARNFPGGGDVVQSVPENGTPLDTRLYTSAPLTETEVVGAPVLRLAISSTAVHRFQISAKIYDVSPDGSARMVNRGCMSLPGGTEDGALALWPNAYVFAAGHRLALAIAAVDFPVFAPDKEPQRTTILAETRLSLPTIPK